MPAETPRPSLKLDTTGKMPPPQSASETPRPILKLNSASRQASFSGETPTPSGEKKTIKIKINASQPATPAATPGPQIPTKTKAGRAPKPTAKLIEAKKRSYDDSDDEDRPMAASRLDTSRPSKMIKIKNSSARTPATPHASTPISSIKFKPRGEPVDHTPGDAYDSEASDKETDPVREQTFIMRVMPGLPAEYLRKALADGTIGIAKAQGGADFGIQFVDAKERRALVTIDGHHYAAVLVDLPTITEAMKTWDRKNMMKNSDISQMLLCFAEVRNEQEARVIPLPLMAGKVEPKWPHGITPPMHDAQNRRFRKAISEKQWQSTATQVKRLIEDDEAAEETHIEWIDDNDDAEYDDEDDAEGEEAEEADGYFPPQDVAQVDDMEIDAPGEEDDDEDDADLLAEMEAAMAEEDAAMSEVAEGATPAAALEAPTPMTINTPAAGLDEPVSEEDEDEEDVSDEDEEDDDDEEDEEKVSRDRERREKMVDLKNYEEQLKKAESELLAQTNPILKGRLKTRIANLKKEIQVKKAALNIQEEEE
ncbi:TAFII55 protein conserved region-domain-containing protein [Microdochium trichocladiopsis]|uniref:TAFII55 protein conserved region-domain-containing protein n=1 Tax=Microdochium trichocladiopsis TaxID=1682393 RepID=A0A9P8YBP2_9PEZI|nr:TAFII55 protein conserved region-domain-containing protein [Microdochium trichocladiopsis]KAH7035094.1 TAFII55 protein conserved region-domain-containing protein [Microdochium trichocladiopsis]